MSGKWSGGWFNATLYLPPFHQLEKLISKFTRLHKRDPEFFLEYNDGDMHFYRRTQSPSTPIQIIDEDGDCLTMCRMIPSQIEGAGILLQGPNRSRSFSIAVGPVGSSFDAEIKAAIHAFQTVHIFPITDSIRWFTDSLSLVEAIQGNPKGFTQSVQILRESMEQLMKCGTPITAVWIRSHCGLKENKEADKRANAGIDQPLSSHQRVPISAESAKSILKFRPKGTLVTLEDVPDNFPINHHRAKVTINQLIADCSPLTKAFFKEKNQKRTCARCQTGAVETVEHLMLRCPGRARSRMKFFPRLGNTPVATLCHDNSRQVLEFLHYEDLLTGPVP